MKKTKFGGIGYSIAMSQQTGCIVILRVTGADQKVVGSLTRADSMAFAQSVIDYQAAPQEAVN